jgi:hypothetical protein
MCILCVVCVFLVCCLSIVCMLSLCRQWVICVSDLYVCVSDCRLWSVCCLRVVRLFVVCEYCMQCMVSVCVSSVNWVSSVICLYVVCDLSVCLSSVTIVCSATCCIVSSMNCNCLYGCRLWVVSILIGYVCLYLTARKTNINWNKILIFKRKRSSKLNPFSTSIFCVYFTFRSVVFLRCPLNCKGYSHFSFIAQTLHKRVSHLGDLCKYIKAKNPNRT